MSLREGQKDGFVVACFYKECKLCSRCYVLGEDNVTGAYRRDSAGHLSGKKKAGVYSGRKKRRHCSPKKNKTRDAVF